MEDAFCGALVPLGDRALPCTRPLGHPGSCVAEDTGRKDDQGKEQWRLLPLEPVVEIVRVLMVGAEKYGAGNWVQVVADDPDRYYDALWRHVSAWREGEERDPETGHHHLAHAACCLLFLMANDMDEENRWSHCRVAYHSDEQAHLCRFPVGHTGRHSWEGC